MTKWQKVKLGDVCEISSGGTPSRANYAYWQKGTIPWVKISDMNGRYIDKTEEMITQQGVDNSSAKLYKKGTLLYSIFASIGEVGILNIDATCNQAIAGLEPKYNICKNYMYYVLKALKHLVCKKGRGVAQNNINLSILKNIEIPLPPKDEQKRIAKELDAVSDLLAKQKQLLTEQDTLIKATFYDMFGDTVTNDKGWTIEKLEKLGTCKNGINFNKEEQGIRCYLLNVGDFQNHSVLDKTTYFSEVVLKKMPDDDYFLKSGDIVFVRSNGNKNLVGRCVAIYPQDNKVLYSGFCIRFRIKQDDITTKYLLYYFKDDNIRKLLVGRGANIQNLNQKVLHQLNIPVPPLSLQQKFADIVEQIEAQKQKIKSAITETETLFNALMAKYFDEE